MNLTLHIVEAANLSLIGMMKSVPDPYCKVIIGNRRQKSAFLRKTTNPRWDFRFTFDNVSPQSPVHIEVRDHARLKKDRMIGVLETDVQKLLNNPISWWPLVGREGTGGTLYIDAKCTNFQNLPMGQQQMFQQQGMGMGTMGSNMPITQGLGSTIPQQGLGSTFPQQGLGSGLTQGVGSGLIGSTIGQGLGSTLPQQGLGSTLPQQGLGSTLPQQGLGSTLSQGSYVPQGQGTTGVDTSHKHHGLSTLINATGLTSGVGTSHKHHGLSNLVNPTEFVQGGSTIPQQGLGSTLPQQGLGSTVPLQGFETGSSFPQQGIGMGTMGSTMPITQGMGSTIPQQGLGSTLPQQGLGSTVPMQGMGTGTVPQQGSTTHIHIHKN